MTKQRIYKLILLLIGCALIGVYLYIILQDNYSVPRRLPFTRQTENLWKSCENLSGFINSTIRNANYCTKDEDCIISHGTVPCNCWSLVNKETDLNHNPYKQAVAAYLKQECSAGSLCESCSYPPTQAEITCQSNVCVTQNVYTEPKVYVLTDKKTYAKGKKFTGIRTVIKNNLDHEVVIPTSCSIPFTLLAYDGLKWINYGVSPTRDCVSVSPPLIIAPTEKREFSFTLEQVYEYSSFTIKPGTYKFIVAYIADQNLLGVVGYNEAFSDEFVITDDTAQTSNEPLFYSIRELNNRTVPAGRYATAGYVRKIRTCPPCLDTESCTPCYQGYRANYIIISQEGGSTILPDDRLTEDQLALVIKGDELFEVPTKYSFFINIYTDYTFTGRVMDSMMSSVQLVSYKEAEAVIQDPSPIDAARIVGSYTSPGESSKVAIQGTTVFLTDITEGLLAIDVSDPTNPKLLDSLKIEAGGAYAVALNNDISRPQLLVSGYGNAGIALVDLSALLGLSKSSRHLSLSATGFAKRSVQNIARLGSFWYLAIDGPEFEVMSVRHASGIGMSTLTSLGTTPATPDGHVLDVKTLSPQSGIHMLLVAQGEKGIALFRLDNFQPPALMEILTLDGYAYAIGVDSSNPKNEIVYVITGPEIILIRVNPFGDAKHLQIETRLSLQGTGEAIAVHGGIGAVALWEEGVEIIDVSNPLKPVSLAVVDTPGRARDIAIQQKDGATYHIYVADDRDDLQVIEFEPQTTSTTLAPIK